jgi:hypothetical protein
MKQGIWRNRTPRFFLKIRAEKQDSVSGSPEEVFFKKNELFLTTDFNAL